MSWGERLADEAANHYAALRDRRVPWPLAWAMTFVFHAEACKSVFWDDQFKPVVGRMLEEVRDGDAP